MPRFLPLLLSGLLLPACAPGTDDTSAGLPPSLDVAEEKSIISITIDAAIADGSATVLRLCDVVGTSAVGCWDLDEAGGTVAADDSPYGNDGAYRNGVVETGRCADFDGVNDYVHVRDDAAFDIGRSDLSLSVWVYADAAAVSGVKNLVDHRALAPAPRGYALYLYDGRPGLQLADPSGYSNFTSASAITAGEWHHIAVTVDRDAPTGIQFYVDGAPWGATQDPTGRPGTLTNAGRLVFGRSAIGTANSYGGYLCRVAVWDSAIDGADVASITAFGL